MFQSLFRSRTQSRDSKSTTKVNRIDAKTLHQRLQEDKSILLVDVRTPAEYEFDGHIAGSRLLPLQTLMQRSNELPRNRPIVCVCRSGNRSQTACEILAGLGFDDLTNLSGGMIGWRSNGLPST